MRAHLSLSMLKVTYLLAKRVSRIIWTVIGQLMARIALRRLPVDGLRHG
jgi:hypothetical protein